MQHLTFVISNAHAERLGLTSTVPGIDFNIDTSSVGIGESNGNADDFNYYDDTNTVFESRGSKENLQGSRGLCQVIQLLSYIDYIADAAGGCFPESETVELNNGQLRQLKDVVIGDKILSADKDGIMSFSTVVALAHPSNSILADFVSVATDSLEVQITPDHLLLAKDYCSSSSKMTLKFATELVVGSCILTKNGVATIKSLETISRRGVYSVITEKEYIIVNGFVVSPFSQNHAITQKYYDIHRFLYTYFPDVLLSGALLKIHRTLGNFFLAEMADEMTTVIAP